MSQCILLPLYTIVPYMIHKPPTYFCISRFCPSVFFYLCTIVPCVWILELDMLEERITARDFIQVGSLIFDTENPGG